MIPHPLRRRRPRRTARPHAGQAPGTLVAAPMAVPTVMRWIRYDAAGLTEGAATTADDLPSGGEGTLWIDVQGLADLDAIRAIGERFGLHPLAVADIVHTHQRPKTEAYDGFSLTVMRLPTGGPPFDSEQIAYVLTGGVLLTFQERHGDCFDPVRERLRGGGVRFKTGGPGYLLYALIDSMVDAFFPILERYGDLAEALEARVIAAPDPGLVADIHLLKRELLDVRRALWPQRDAINVLLREGSTTIPAEVRPYLRDCADHCFQLMDMVEIDREIAQGLIDLHLSSVSNRMNGVMKVLTIISTFFMPMTFMAGLWGMNFDRSSPWNMPELGWTYGYPIALGAMALSGVALVAAFWRIGWINFPHRRKDDAPDG